MTAAVPLAKYGNWNVTPAGGRELETVRKIFLAFKEAGARQNLAFLFAAFMIAAAGGLLHSSYTPAPVPVEATETERTVNYSEFLSLVNEGAIVSAKVTASRVDAEGPDGQSYVLHHDRWLYSTAFPKDLAEAGVDVRFPTPEDRSLGDMVSSYIQAGTSLLILVLVLALVGYLWVSMRGGTASGWPNVSKDGRVRFADVAGQDETKYELEEIRDFLRDPSSYEKTGAKPPRGVLMVGPPGTGKTLLARALATEAGVSFIPVTGSDFSAMFVGVGRNRVVKLFRKARRHAPCIVFIDEIDSVGRKRGGNGSDAGREYDTTLNQLLTEMNGFSAREGIVVIGATNRIDVLDDALLRPGRFDRQVHVTNADRTGRREILEVHAKGKPLSPDVDLGRVAAGTPGFSGADLENLVNEAAILAARQRLSQILPEHFEEARDKVLMGLQRKAATVDEDETRLVAVHEAGHALVACLTSGSDPVHHATVIPRGRSLGLVMRLPEKDRTMVPRSKLLADLDVAMAGRAAEEVVFGSANVCTGAESDIEQATATARRMVAQWGMSDVIGMVRVEPHEGRFPPEVETEVRNLIEGAYARAKELILEHRTALDALSDALVARKSLDGEEVRDIVRAGSSVKAA